jgi:mannose/fructose/N-acetylgalactosamine-specific phosphotransferase system component IIB
VSWVLHRVDDRLIHGQVVVTWSHHLHPRRVWVVDDSCAGNDWERDLLSACAPDLEVRVVNITEAVEGYPAEAAAPGNAFLLVRCLQTALELVERGAAIHTFNLGGLHYAAGKDKVNEYIYLDDDDRRAARALLERGVRLEVQDVPAARPEPLTALDPGVSPRTA